MSHCWRLWVFHYLMPLFLFKFLKYQSSNIISQKEISQILQEAAEANLAELPEASTRALHLFLCQVREQWLPRKMRRQSLGVCFSLWWRAINFLWGGYNKMKRDPAAASLACCCGGCAVNLERKGCQQLPKICHHISWPLECPPGNLKVLLLCVEMRNRGMKEQTQQFPVGLEIILSSNCPDSEQSLPGGAWTVRDHSDLAGAPPGTEDHMCKTSGHCVSFAGQMPLMDDVRVVGVTGVEGILKLLLLPLFQLMANRIGKILSGCCYFGMKDFLSPRFEKTLGEMRTHLGWKMGLRAGVAFICMAEVVSDGGVTGQWLQNQCDFKPVMIPVLISLEDEQSLNLCLC